MFCPQCRAEYREGFFRCSDCDITLVDQLPADRSVTDRRRGFETDHPELVVLRTFSTVIEADLAKNAWSPLESIRWSEATTREGRPRVWRSVRALNSFLRPTL